jgi:hypothetical protein
MKKPIKDWKLVRIISQTAEGKNKAGQVLHGALDILPLPNQFIGKALKAIVAGEWNQTKRELLEAFTLRNTVAIALTTAFIMGWVTPDQLTQFTEMLNEILNSL